MSQEERIRESILDLEREWKYVSEQLNVTRNALQQTEDDSQTSELIGHLLELVDHRQRVGAELDRLEKLLHSRSDSPDARKAFLSYKRHSEPDESIALYLDRFLRDHGIEIFIDQKLTVGMDWVEEIYAQISQSDFLIVILSPASAVSEMVLEEVRFADKQWRATGKPRILPIRVGDEHAPLPYGLGEYLDPLQYVAWSNQDDSPGIAHSILNVISGKSGASRMNPPLALDTTALYQLMDQYLSAGDLRELAFMLKVDYDNLAGTIKRDKAMALVQHCDRMGRLVELADAFAKQRPNVNVVGLSARKESTYSILWKQPATLSPDGQPVTRPLSSFDPRVLIEPPTGLVSLESRFYIDRHTDTQLFRQLSRTGTTTTIRAPRQMGKTSLLVRGVEHARQRSANVVFFDFQMVDESYLGNLETFLYYFARYLATNLDVKPATLATYWKSELGPKDRLSDFIEDELLVRPGQNILIAIDEADRLLESTFYKEFFGLVRAWDTRRGFSPAWKKLSVVMVISTQPFLLIEDVNQSPFNVGLRIELDDFTLDQIRVLNERHGSPVAENDLEDTLAFLGGHPYLMRQALFTIVDEGITWNSLKKMAVDDSGPYSSHLRQYLWQLKDQPELVDAFKSVLRNRSCRDEKLAIRLNAAGLIKRSSDGTWAARCMLYEQYFGSRL